ncbi:hypothetical protein GIB67_008785 [Kingdonia uniflora]|uniref:Uncharacterized protein n=1 Tax=Kingdonia uniflora TaxID=39325 RepID=A0A7J7P5W6_9MAGN|nr:hypothetical protein GIB67_008785 [Kingdonia uniflora]
MDDSSVIGTVTADNPTVSSWMDVGLHTGNETGQFFKSPKNVNVAKKFLQYKKSLDKEWGHYEMNVGLWFRTLVRPGGNIEYYQVLSLDQWKGSMDIGNDIDIVYYNETSTEVAEEGFLCYLNQVVYGLKPNLKVVADTSNLFDVVSCEGNELNKKKESDKDIRASSKGVNLKAVELEALDLAKRDPIRLDTQIRSSISQLSVVWKSVAEVLKLATADHDELREQIKKEKALHKDQFEKEVAASKQEVEHEAKKVADIAVASRNKLIQTFYFWGLSREDVNLALPGKYNEIFFPGDDASPVAEQTPAPPVADNKTEEVAGAKS